jgi:membrane protein YdbS with pleckstrin-like domain
VGPDKVYIGAMPYPRRLLGSDEQVVLDFHPHWISLTKPAGFTILWLVALGALLYLLRHIGGLSFKLVVLGAVAVVWAITAGRGFLRWRTTEYVLTNARLIIREGVVSKSGREIPLENITDITFRQSIFERIVGSGDLLVESAGEEGQEPFHTVPRPHLVQNEIYRQIEANRARMIGGGARAPAGAAAVPSTPQGPSIPRQIEELARLRDQGLISDAEFEAKKNELLRRM